jgi:hypothetical protein
MKTHTIRNKTSTNPIVKFTPKFIALLNEQSEWTRSVVTSGLLDDLYHLTGKRCMLDFDTETKLLFNGGVIEEINEPIEYHYIRKWFVKGRRTLDCDLERQISVAQALDDALKGSLNIPTNRG